MGNPGPRDLALGATPVGIANMSAATSKYRASLKAILIIPLVGAFFLGLVNALVIKTILAMPFLKMGGLLGSSRVARFTARRSPPL